MIKKLPEKLIAAVPKNVRFYNFYGDDNPRVIQVDVSCSGIPKLEPGDVVISSEQYGVILGRFQHPCGYPDPLVAFYSEVTEKIIELNPRKEGLAGFDFSKFKKVGHIEI